MRCVECSYHDVCAEWATDTAFVGFPYDCEGDVKPCSMYTTDKDAFVAGVKESDDYLTILNWYRNLFHAENPNTERGIVARAINELFMAMRQKENHRETN